MGLPASTTISVTFAAIAQGAMVSAVYVTGLETADDVVDVTDGQGQASAGAWDTTATTTTFANTLLWGGCLFDGNGTNTPTNSANEMHDFFYSTETWSMCTEYKTLTSTGSASLTGT